MRQLLLLMSVAAALSCELQPPIRLTNPNSRSSIIEVSWPGLPVSDLNCARGYRICLKDDYSLERCKHVLDASISNYTFTELKSCTYYSISVAVLGENNTISKPVSLTAITAPPPQSTDVNFYRKNHNTIVAYWSYDMKTESTCKQGFKLSACDISGNNCTTRTCDANTDNELELLWEQDCNTFIVNMTVVDSYKQRSDTTYHTGVPGFIDAPENLRVTNYTSSSFDLEWALPASQIGCEFFTRVFTNRVGGSTNDSSSASIINGSLTTHTETGLNPCSKYEVTVTYGTTETAKSAKTTVHTLPKGNTVFQSAGAERYTTDTSKRVVWTTSLTNSYCIAAYTVCWKVQGTIDENCRNVTSTFDDSLIITGLAASSSYQYSIAALLQNGVEYDKVLLIY